MLVASDKRQPESTEIRSRNEPSFGIVVLHPQIQILPRPSRAAATSEPCGLSHEEGSEVKIDPKPSAEQVLHSKCDCYMRRRECRDKVPDLSNEVVERIFAMNH